MNNVSDVENIEEPKVTRRIIETKQNIIPKSKVNS